MVLPRSIQIIHPQRPHLQTLNLLQRFSGNALQIAVHADRGVHDPFDLRFAFGPLFHDGFAFLVQVFLHRREGLDDGFHPLAEARAGQVLVDHFGLAMLAFGGEASPMPISSRVWRSIVATGKAARGLATQTPSITSKVFTPFGNAWLTSIASSALAVRWSSRRLISQPHRGMNCFTARR